MGVVHGGGTLLVFPHAPCPMVHGPCPVPHAPWTLLHAHLMTRPSPWCPMPHSCRPYLGPTSMDAELSFVMANMALARSPCLCYDPFAGHPYLCRAMYSRGRRPPASMPTVMPAPVPKPVAPPCAVCPVHHHGLPMDPSMASPAHPYPMPPIAGTGSLLVAAAHFGAFVLAADLDHRMTQIQAAMSTHRMQALGRTEDPRGTHTGGRPWGVWRAGHGVYGGPPGMPWSPPRVHVQASLPESGQPSWPCGACGAQPCGHENSTEPDSKRHMQGGYRPCMG